MRTFTHLLIDADNTLFDFDRAEHDAFSECCEELHLPSDDAVISLYSRINDEHWKMLEKGLITKAELKYRRFEVFRQELGIDFDPEELSRLYIRNLSRKSYLFDGVYELCRDLSLAGYRMGIITNGIKSVQENRFNSSAIAGFFEYQFISDNIGYEKPSKEFFDFVMNRFEGINEKDALVIGDSLSSDVRGGVESGIPTCWYNPGRLPVPPDLKGRITCIVHSYQDIRKLLLP